MMYVIARNASDRPTLQHRLVDGTASVTLCGVRIVDWSRSYQNTPIKSVLCRRCATA